MSKMIKNPLAIVVITAALATTPVLVSAQEPDTTQTPAVQQQEQVEVSEKKIDQFVSAYVEVQKINKNYSEKLQVTEQPEKATELQQEAQTKMQKAVIDSGLTIPEYQQIASLAGRDEGLRARIQDELEN